MPKQVLVVGTGFFALFALGAAYDAFVPLLFRGFVSNLAVIGLLMTIDNYFALFLQPWWGAHSDGSNTRFGRRVPYLLIGMPIAALFTVLVPFAAQLSLWALIGVVIALNAAVSIWRAPILSLLNDVFPAAYRSRASGVAYWVGFLGAAVTLFAGGSLYDTYGYAPFIIVASALVLAALVVGSMVREPRLQTPAAEQYGPFVAFKALRRLASSPQKDPLVFLGAAFCFQLAVSGVGAYFTIYVRDSYGITSGQAATTASWLLFGSLLATVPAGFAAARYGGQRLMFLSLAMLSLIYFVVPLSNTLALTSTLWAGAGFCFGVFVVNGIILFQSFAQSQEVGLFSGLYLAIPAAAQIAGPPLWGVVSQVFGLNTIWVMSGCATVLAMLLIARVRNQTMHKPELMAESSSLSS